MIDLCDKSIVITGASSGIGKACAIGCSLAGARVHLVGRNLDKLKETFAMLTGVGHSLHAIDISDNSKISQMVDNIVSNSGRISGFIHSAGYQIVTPLQAMNAQKYYDMFAVNTTSAFEISRLITKKANHIPNNMSIVFISSVMSVVASAGLTAYCASKAALVGGARAIAIELSPKKIRVNCVSPGTVSDTQMTENLISQLSPDEYESIVCEYPIGLGSTTDVSSICIFLLSDKAKWITGQNFIIDGGYSVR